MADIVTTTRTLGIGIDWTDAEEGKDKTTYLKIANPKNSLTESEIKTAVGTVLTNGILLDAKGGALPTDTSIISTAYTEDQEVIEVDIGLS